MPRPKRRHHSPPAMAKPSRQKLSPSAAPSGARGRQELSRRCLSPRGRVSTRPAGRGWSEGTGASRRCGRGRFFGDFLVATRKSLARRGETRPIVANFQHASKRTTKAKALDPGLRRGDESLPIATPTIEARQPAGNGEAEPAAAFPFCGAERSPRPAGIVASMSEPERASFDATRRARVARGHRREPALRQGALLCLLSCRHKKDGRPPGRDPANHRQPKARHQANDKDQRHWTPACAGATNRGRPPNPMT